MQPLLSGRGQRGSGGRSTSLVRLRSWSAHYILTYPNPYLIFHTFSIFDLALLTCGLIDEESKERKCLESLRECRRFTMRDTKISKQREIKGPNTRYSGSLYLKLVI